MSIIDWYGVTCFDGLAFTCWAIGGQLSSRRIFICCGEYDSSPPFDKLIRHGLNEKVFIKLRFKCTNVDVSRVGGCRVLHFANPHVCAIFLGKSWSQLFILGLGASVFSVFSFYLFAIFYRVPTVQFQRCLYSWLVSPFSTNQKQRITDQTNKRFLKRRHEAKLSHNAKPSISKPFPWTHNILYFFTGFHYRIE